MTSQLPIGEYFNTTHLKGDRLKDALETCSKQDAKILEFFITNHTESFTPIECWERMGQIMLIGSVRRSINTLTRLNYLYKTMETRDERYGKPNYCWKAIKPKS